MRGGLALIVVLLSSASPALGAALSPGRFAVQGKPLVSAGHLSAGRSVSVFAKPVAVTVDGCVTSAPSVRVKHGVARVAARLACNGIRGRVRLVATIQRGIMRGSLISPKRTRAFVARLVPPKGRLLRGRPGARARAEIANGDAITRHSASEVSVIRGVKVVRTELLIKLSPSATVGQVNAVLTLVGGRIVGSFAHSRLITVGIPDPGSLATLDALRRLLQHQRGVAGVERSMLAKAADLPQGFSAPPLKDPGDLALHQLLALRMPAAWNARAALDVSRRPLLLIEDFFGNGLPSPSVDARLENPSAFLIGAPDKFAHGYHVLGIAAGNHDSDGSGAGLVTGVFPASTDLDVIDMAGGLSDSDTLNLLRDEVLARSRVDPHIVINTSLTFGSDAVEVVGFAAQWLNSIRDNNLEERVLQATAAGNNSVDKNHLGYAFWESAWTGAALNTNLADAKTKSALTNTLVVESVSDGGAPAFDPGCRSVYSDVAGNISAFGDNVYSNLLGSDAGTLSGTSMATPEIAALGEYLWTIAPDLTARQVVHALELNFLPPLACENQPAADAYAATLSLDHPGDLSKAGSPVRFAILDQNHDGRFDEADVSAFADHIFVDSAPTDRDWSRYDLNGDGFTGGDTTVPFDLDTNGSTRAGGLTLGTVSQTVHDKSGNPVPLQFDEHHASDADVLCYYAYSSLYTPAASDDQRDKILGDHCQPPVVITACGTEADSSTSASFGADQQTNDKGPGPGGSTSSLSIPQCAPPMNAVLPDNKSEVPSQTGCGSDGKSPCDPIARANGTMTASAALGLHGGSIQMSAQGDISGQITFSNADNQVASANVSAGSNIGFKVNKPCQYSVNGNVSISQSGGGTVSFQRMVLNGPSGPLLTVTSGPGSATGTFQPGSYGLGGSANIQGNTAPPILGFTAAATVTGSINLTC